MTPEEKIAKRLIDKHALIPPIDILNLLKNYADYEETFFPFTVDALCVQRKGSKPKVFLDMSQSPKRKRFTLAHELGHLVIPWHAGTMICHTDGAVKYNDHSYSIIESEANRFASEVLMPSSWIQEIIVESKFDIEKIVSQVVLLANVSLFAALISVAKKLPKGYLIILTEEDTIIQDFKSLGTKVSINRFNDIEHVQMLSNDDGMFSFDKYNVFWFRFGNSTQVTNSDERMAKDILREIVKSCFKTSEEQTHITQSINGIFGAANSSRKKESDMTREEFHDLLQQRLASHPRLKPIICHCDFQHFINNKINELMKK